LADTRANQPSPVSALAVAALVASGGALSAQTTFTMPTDICTWDWASPATGQLLVALKDQDLLAHTTMEMAKTCPEKLCEINWQGYATGNGSLPGEMLCELGHRQLFFAPLIEGLAATCPAVAQTMTDRLPEVYDTCGTWPRVEPGGTGGIDKCQELNGEYQNGKRPPRECYEGEGDGPEPPAIGPGFDFDV
jgi:hypothetical protein